MKQLIMILLFATASIILSQNQRLENNLNFQNSLLKEENAFPKFSQQYKGSMSDYYVITKLDSANGNFAYSTPIDIYKDSLLVTRLNNISDNKSNPYYKYDNMYRGSEPAIYEYSYNAEKNISKIEYYSFDDSSNIYLRGTDYYYYTNGRLDSISLWGNYNNSLLRYEYNNDTVTSFYSSNGVLSYKTKKIYSNNLIIRTEGFRNDNNSQIWIKSSIVNYYYNPDNTLKRKEYFTFNSDGEKIFRGNVNYFYNADKTLNKVISERGSYHSAYSYFYGTDNFISILTPKDFQKYNGTTNEIKFNFYSYNSSNVNLSFSVDDGVTWQSIEKNLNSNAPYLWTIPQTEQQDYLFKAEDVNDSSIYDIAFVNVSGVVSVSKSKITSKLFKLSQNYPNPFNPSTKITYVLPKQLHVTLKIFDVLGKEIKTLVNKEQLPGEYKLDFNASNLPSGIYFYRLQAGDFIKTRKMILLK